MTPDEVQTGPDQLTRADGTILTANHDTGFFDPPDGDQVPPGWHVNIGIDNFARVFQSDGIREPMVLVFLWTFACATLTVATTFALGRTQAVIPGTVIPAGETEILASFTDRLAFDNAGQQFGLAGAITLLIFVVVAAISYANVVPMARAAQRRSGRT